MAQKTFWNDFYVLIGGRSGLISTVLGILLVSLFHENIGITTVPEWILTTFLAIMFIYILLFIFFHMIINDNINRGRHPE